MHIHLHCPHCNHNIVCDHVEEIKSRACPKCGRGIRDLKRVEVPVYSEVVTAEAQEAELVVETQAEEVVEGDDTEIEDGTDKPRKRRSK